MVTAPAPSFDASAPSCLMVTAPVSVLAEAAIFKASSGLVPPIIPPIPTVPLPLIMVKLSLLPLATVCVALIVESKSIFPPVVVPVLTSIVPPDLARTKAPLISIVPPAELISSPTVIVVPVNVIFPIAVPITYPPGLSNVIVPVPASKVTLTALPRVVP